MIQTVMMTSKTLATTFWWRHWQQSQSNPHTTISTKVVSAMKMLQASFNNDANIIVKQATKEKSAIKN